MDNNPYQLWEFLRHHGVKKIRQKGDEFEFLMANGKVVTPISLFNFLRREIGRKRPQKTVIMRIPRRFGKTSRLFLLDALNYANPSDTLEAIKGFRDESDRQKDEDCTRELEELNQQWQDLLNLLNLVRFGEEEIATDLLVPDKLLHKRQSKKVVLLKDAKQSIHLDLQETHGNRLQIDICRDFLKQNEIQGKSDYTPDQLSNAVSKYIEKLRNKK